MYKKIGAILALVLSLILLGYSATRSLDFIRMTLPPDRQGVAYFGLAALDGGLVVWLLVYLYGSRGGIQRAIAFLMIIVDLGGAVAMFTMDTLYNTGKAGMTIALTADELETAVLALSGIIALNIAATVAHHMTEPDQLRAQAEEEAFDKVETATLKQISKNADQLAAQLAPTLAADWMGQTQARYMAGLGTSQVGRIIDLPTSAVREALPSPSAIPVSGKKDNPVSALFSWATGKGGKKYEAATVAPAAAVSSGSPAPKVESTAEEVVEDFLSGLPEMTPFPTGEEAAEPEPLGELDGLLARAARASYEKNDEAARELFARAYGVAQTRGERERVHQLMTFRGLTEVVFRDQPFQKW